jgi:L-ascorbate metabolism protein UlaG (beta-lactamase superfamily)
MTETGSWARRLLASAAPQAGVELTWLGQAGFVVRDAGSSLLIDPFLSPHPDRLIPPPDAPDAFSGIDAVLVTHEHLDHLDAGACAGLAAASPEAVFLAPRPITGQLADLGIDDSRIVAMQPGDERRAGAARVDAVPACHGIHPSDAYSLGREQPGGDVRFLGYVIDVGGVRLYHAGDTIDFDGLAADLRRLRVEVALVPINGRSAEREAADIVGNLDPAEAVGLAAAAGARAAIPMHYDMFAANLGDVGAFTAAASAAHPGLAIVVPGRLGPLRLAGW